MKSKGLIRLCGLIAIINGILLLGFGILPDVLLPMDEPLLNWVLDPQWFMLNFLAFILTILTPISILGFYAKQIENVGNLALFGFVLVYLGGMLYIGVQFDETFSWPIMAEHAPELIDSKGPLFSDPKFSLAYLLMALLFIPGIIIFSIATVRGRILPKWGAILMAVGCPFAYGGIMVPQLLRASGASLGAIGFIWLGYVIFSDKQNHN